MDGQSFSREVAFSQSVINIGADQGNDIVLRGSSVADFHVLMHYDSGRWSISPLNGAYRTTINGRSLDVEGAVLQNGSIVEIGTYRLTMMLNGVNTDIIIQSQSGADTASMDSDSIGSDQNIQIEITKMDRTELDAGSAAEIELTVTNAGPLVANMQLQLQGIPSTWVQIIPPVLNLNEGRKGTFLVRISPPRNSSAEAGLYNLHFVAISPNYPRNTGIADTSLTILPYSEFLISGPTPMQLKLSHGKPTDIANFVIINNSNSVGSYFVQSRDDSNELNFAYQKTGSGALAAGQEMVTVRPGDSVQIPMEVTAKKIPLLGVSSKHHHYYTNVTPSDRPGDAQTIAGEVTIKPAINTMLLLLLLAVLIIAVGFIFQPYIHLFECQEGRRSQVIVAGSAAQLSWNVSGFASTITLNNGQTDSEVSNNGTQYVSPTVSTTYTLTAENFISNLLHITHKKIVQVLVVPSRPAIDVFSVDKGKALYDETVTINWSVEPNATAASITSNKSTTQLAPENYTGKLAQGYQTDTLISLKAQNDSGYDLKSLFINVASDNISLTRFTVWVRPNGIAIPEDNDVRRTTRWGSLQATVGTEQPARSGASGVNPQPAAQSNTLEIPDNFNSTGAGTQLLNPEVMAASGQTMPSSGSYSYQPPASGSGSAPSELLVSPSLNPTPTPVPTAAAPAVAADSVIARPASAPVTSPEGSSSNRDFTIKLAEVIEDPLADSGYRVIEYYPNYVLQKQEQILVEWSVDGVSKVKIENLSGDDLQNTGNEYAYPEKSTTYTLNAQVGETKKAYSLPVNVAGDPDDGEGSGLKCDLKANATTLKVPGSVMLTWTGGGNNRVQLISSTQAEKENADAEKKKEEEAKAKGEKYEQPKQNQPLTGGTIGDYLQPSGFMRVNVDKQTTFVLNAYDASNNVICTKSVEVKYEGGNDKKDIKLKITKIADENGVSQTVYGKGQMVSYTVALTDFVKGTDPTGAIAITDGTSTCSVNWPVNTCSFQAKKTGELTITAVYAGDDNYKKATATAYETVVDKMPTATQINSAIKPAGDKADVEVELLWDAKHSYGMVPGGTVTLTAGSTSCDVDMGTETMTCAGDVTVNTVKDDGSIAISVKNMGLKDATPDRVTAAYKGDAYFMPSTSQSVLFRKVNTQISIVNDKDAKRYPYKPDANHADLETLFNWVVKTDDKGDPVWGRTAVNGRTPTGTISFILTDSKASDYGKCEYDLTSKKFSCEGSVTPGNDAIYNQYSVKEMLLANPAADRVRAEYSGDSIFNASKSATVLFDMSDTLTEITQASKSPDGKVGLHVKINPEKENPYGLLPLGTIKFTSGSKTCTLETGDDPVNHPDKVKLTDCNGEAVYNAETKTYKITDMEMGDKAGDTISAVYSGDSYYKGSTSPTVSFGKVDTALVLDGESVRKDAGDPMFVNLSGVLSWKQSDLEDKNIPIDTKPTGTITFKFGTNLNDTKDVPNKDNVPIDICKLDLETMDFDCAGEDTDIKKITSSEQLELTLKKILLSKDNIGADRVKALYSGDTYFNSSESLVSLFKKLDPQLKIVRITDENGKEHQWYAPEQTVIVEFDIASGATGKVKLSVDTATCEADLPQKSCKLQLAKVTGVRTAQASYGGDANYYNGSAEKKVSISEPKDLTIEIIKITDKNETEQKNADGDYVYAKLDNVIVYVGLSDFDEREVPTGDIKVSIGDSTCTISYPEKSCPMTLPDTANTYNASAEYQGNTYYAKKSAETVKVIVDKYKIDLQITKITNTNQIQGEYITQPYYVYDTKTQTGQTIRVCTFLSEYEHEEPTGNISIWDYIHDKVNPLSPDTVWTQKCFEFAVKKFTGEITLTAHYKGDDNYPSRDATRTIVVQNKIDPELYVYPAYRTRESMFKNGVIEFAFDYDRELPDQYNVSPFVDETGNTLDHQKVDFSINDVNFCSFDLSADVTGEPTSVGLSGSGCGSGATIKLEDGVYTIEKAVFPEYSSSETIVGKYDGNTYFYEDTAQNEVYKEDAAYTHIDLSDVLKINNEVDASKGHAFFTATMSYNPNVEDESGVKQKPAGKLLLNNSIECPFNVETDPITFACGTVKESGNRIIFTFVNTIAPNSADKVSVRYPAYGRFDNSNIAEATYQTESVPSVSVDTAQKTASYKADLDISVTGMGPLTKKYEVYQYLNLSSKAKEEDPDSRTCKLILYPSPHLEGDGDCEAFEVRKNGDTYSLTHFQGIIEKTDMWFAAALMNEYASNPFAEGEFPVDAVPYTFQQVETNLEVWDALKYNNTHAFLSFDIIYDDEAAEEYGATPSKYLRLRTKSDDGADNKQCVICLSEDDCPDNLAPFCDDYGDQSRYAHFVIDQSAGTAHWELRNVFVSEWRTQFSLEYFGDPLFENSSNDYMSFTRNKPEVSIQEALTSSNGIYTAFKVTGLDYLTDKYIQNQTLRFESNSGGTSCDYSIYDRTFTGGCTADEVKRNGDDWVIRNLTGILSEGDTELKITFKSDHIDEDKYPNDSAEYRKLQTDIRVYDALYTPTYYAFLTVEMTYDQLGSDIFGVKPTGMLKINSDQEPTGKTCSFDLSSGAFPCGSLTQSGNKVTFIINRYWARGAAKIMYAEYGGDQFYAGDKDESSLQTENAVIEIRNAKRTNKNDHAYAAIRVSGIGSLTEKYNVYSRVRFGTIEDTSSGYSINYCSFDRKTLELITSSCSVGEIRKEGDVYIIKDLAGSVLKYPDRFTAALSDNKLNNYVSATSGISYFGTTLRVSDVINLTNVQDNGRYLTLDLDYNTDFVQYYGDITPTGDINITSNSYAYSPTIGSGSCISATSTVCNRWTISEGNVHGIIQRVGGSDGEIQVQYGGDDIFRPSSKVTEFVRNITPAVTFKTQPRIYQVSGPSVRNMDLQFEVSDYELLVKYQIIYDLFIQASSGNRALNDGNMIRASIRIPNLSIPSTSGGGTVTRDGNTLTVTGWGKDASSDTFDNSKDRYGWAGLRSDLWPFLQTPYAVLATQRDSGSTVSFTLSLGE